MDYKLFLPGFISGFSEMLIFHPFDTIGKRIMNEGKNTSFKNLYKGVGYAGLYRIPQRIFKFSAQPIINDKVKSTIGENKKRNAFISGAIVGASETILMPFDILKIRAQTNTLNNGLFGLIKTNPTALFKGAKYTAIRGSISSSCLFGVKAISDDMYKDHTKLSKHVIGSTYAGLSAVMLASPFDVLKTRAQTGSYNGNILKELIIKEGYRGLFLGIVPKTIVISPKLIFSFFIASYIQDILNE